MQIEAFKGKISNIGKNYQTSCLFSRPRSQGFSLCCEHNIGKSPGDEIVRLPKKKKFTRGPQALDANILHMSIWDFTIVPQTFPKWNIFHEIPQYPWVVAFFRRCLVFWVSFWRWEKKGGRKIYKKTNLETRHRPASSNSNARKTPKINWNSKLFAKSFLQDKFATKLNCIFVFES